MAIEIKIPRLGWSMDEGIFAGWLKHDGEPIRAGDPLFSLEGEKATQDVEAIDDGTLSIPSNAPVAGEKVAVGTVVGYLLRAGESIPRPGGRRLRPSRSLSPARTAPRPPGIAKNHLAAKPTSSPLARRVAREHGIDWTQLRGSGITGRIRKVDVLEAVRARQSQVRPHSPRSPGPSPQPDAPDHRRADDRELPDDGPGDLVNNDRRDESRRSSSPVQGRRAGRRHGAELHGFCRQAERDRAARPPSLERALGRWRHRHYRFRRGKYRNRRRHRGRLARARDPSCRGARHPGRSPHGAAN